MPRFADLQQTKRPKRSLRFSKEQLVGEETLVVDERSRWSAVALVEEKMARSLLQSATPRATFRYHPKGAPMHPQTQSNVD